MVDLSDCVLCAIVLLLRNVIICDLLGRVLLDGRK